MPMGVRPMALAGAYTAVIGIESISRNPGALGQFTKTGLSLVYNTWSVDSSFQYMLGALPLGSGILGIDAFYAGTGKIIGRDDMGIGTGQDLNAFGAGGAIAYGANLENLVKNLSAGVSIRILAQSMDKLAKAGILLDAGALYRLNDSFSLGFVYKGFSFSDRPVDSSEIRAGAAYTGSAGDSGKFMISADAGYSIAFGASGSLGLEYTLNNTVAFRAGYEIKQENFTYGGLSGLSAGLGVILGGISMDYAAVTYGDLGFNHVFSLSFQFENAPPGKSVYDRLVTALADQYMIDAQDSRDEGDYEKSLRKLEALQGIMPDYPDIDAKITETRNMLDQNKLKSKVDVLFNEGMDYYIKSKYQEAVVKWQQAKKLNPDFPGINSWLKTSRKAAENTGKADKAEKCFKEGMKSYNKCRYNDALKKWASCDFGDTADRLTYLEEKCREMSGKISVKEGEAEKYFNKGEMAEGVKKVRVILTLCPMNEFASGKLSELKDTISMQVKKYYLEGVDQYTNGNVIEAIGSWEKAIAMDPAGSTAGNARENIEKAKKKLESLKKYK